MGDRYELNHEGEIVLSSTCLCSDKDGLITKMFSQYNSKVFELKKDGPYRKLRVELSNGKDFVINVFSGNIRNESRNAYEKKIQLNGKDPRELKSENTIILGVYVFSEDDDLKDALIVGYPISDDINYNTNPSIRGTFVDRLLTNGKSKGFYFDKESKRVCFRPEFIFYYIDTYRRFHYTGKIEDEVNEETIIEYLSPEWFKKKAQEKKYLSIESNTIAQRKEFLDNYGPDVLKSLTGKELLLKIFKGPAGNYDYLINVLERNTKLFGSANLGNAHNAGLLFKDKSERWTEESSWAKKKGQNAEAIDEQEAIELATTVRDAIISSLDEIRNSLPLTNAEEYVELEGKLEKIFGPVHKYVKHNSIWILKYFQMVIPEAFPTFYNWAWSEYVLDALNVETDASMFVRLGQIAIYENQCNIINTVFANIIYDHIGSPDSPKNLDDYDDSYSEEVSSYDIQDFLDEVYMDAEKFEEIKSRLIAKKNIIFKGAPGVGKTFAAKRLAYAIMGCKDKSRIEFIQFHQNYSYEDFIMGYKPVNDSFELMTGVFYDFCKKAQKSDEKHFFIIDEINRGNLSKIFGELLMLIENNYRGSKHSVRLAYRDEMFYVPDNLYIIGMMNTADRSLAIIDYALRRRFAHIPMVPGFDSEGFKKYSLKYSESKFDSLVSTIKDLNVAITSDDSLGEGFMIGHSYLSSLKDDVDVNQQLKEIVEYDIIPTLEEYWFDNKESYETWSNNLRECLK